MGLALGPVPLDEQVDPVELHPAQPVAEPTIIIAHRNAHAAVPRVDDVGPAGLDVLHRDAGSQ